MKSEIKKIEVKGIPTQIPFNKIKEAFYFFIRDNIHITMDYSSELADEFMDKLKIYLEKETWAEVIRETKR